jgi:hypothetical protein
VGEVEARAEWLHPRDRSEREDHEDRILLLKALIASSTEARAE